MSKKYDVNLVVIGAGAAGLVSSYIAAAVKAKVILIEKHKMGGDCLNTGCVPSKALIRTAKIATDIRRAEQFGIDVTNASVNFPKAMARVHKIINRIALHDSIARYTQLGVECIIGEAEILTPNCVAVNGRKITTKNIIIATGARPAIPDIESLNKITYYTSDTVWDLKQLPKKLLVLGGGAIGCELAQCFFRLGSSVTQLVRGERILKNEDGIVSDEVTRKFLGDGIDLKTSTNVIRFEPNDNEQGYTVFYKNSLGEVQKLNFDVLLLAVGRKANTAGIGLENINIKLSANGSIDVNSHLQSNIKNIYSCGDVIGSYQFTHVASHQAWYASVNSLFGVFKKFKVDYTIIPWATFTDPEVARVGMNEQEALANNIEFELTQYDINDLDRAITDDEDYGFVRVITSKGTDKILGVTIVGYHAAEIITEYVLAMKYKIGLNKILSTIHIYPTYSEANKYAAGVWKRAHKPDKLLSIVEKFNTWMRG
ncbi:MAG: NAD(P)/FAD-dependent oxidoreductase [Gammaproteobacteria bacterium]